MQPRIEVILCFCACLVVFQGSAAAQNAPKWEIEVHGGGLVVNNPTDGTASLPPAGASFTTVVGGFPSRRASSWYFGDGAALLNEILSAFGPAATQRITALNPVLDGPLVERQNGFDVGVRLSRMINSRFTAELTVDYSPSELRITSDAESGIDATRGSFESAFRDLLRTAPISDLSVTSRSNLDSGNGGQLFTAGTLNVALKTTGRVIPYVTGGAGVVSRLGDRPTASLEGNYRFRVVGTFPMNETDAVALRVSAPDNDFVGVVGGGVKYIVSRRWGIRGDARWYLGKYSVDTILDATPAVATALPASPVALFSATRPAIQFNNTLSGPSGQSNLIGPAVSGFKAFEGSGTQSNFAMTGGVFWRF
jgi:hypothetical protein